jgi:hypothetical protein
VYSPPGNQDSLLYSHRRVDQNWCTKKLPRAKCMGSQDSRCINPGQLFLSHFPCSFLYLPFYPSHYPFLYPLSILPLSSLYPLSILPLSSLYRSLYPPSILPLSLPLSSLYRSLYLPSISPFDHPKMSEDGTVSDDCHRRRAHEYNSEFSTANISATRCDREL